MDKSEGKDFFSKTFSSISRKVAKLYQKGQKSVSLASLQRSRKEKLMFLGSKVFDTVSTGGTISSGDMEDDIMSIRSLDSQIAEVEKELEKLKAARTDKKADFSVKTLDKPAKGKSRGKEGVKAADKASGRKRKAETSAESSEKPVKRGRKPKIDGEETAKKATRTPRKKKSGEIKPDSAVKGGEQEKPEGNENENI